MISHHDRTQSIAFRFLLVLMLAALVYATIGLSFHVAWKHALDECRQTQMARGEFVEPEVFSGVVARLFNVTNWPVYAWANWYHFGSVIATRCSHPR